MRSRRRSGQALVPVIFVTSILMLLAIALTTAASRDIRAAANFHAESQRFFAARGAMNYAATALAQTSNNGATYGIVPQGRDTDANGWMQIGDAWVKFEVTDTSGAININTATNATLSRMPLFQSNTDLVACITDWRSTGDQPSQNGAKSEYYNTLTPPYDCKSAPFDTVEELLLVKGITPTILYGSASGSPISFDSTDGTNGTTNSSTGGVSRQAGGGGSGGSTTPGGTPGGSGGNPRPGGGGNGSGGNGAGGGGGNNTGGAAAGGDTDWTDIYNRSTVPLAEYLTTVALERNVSADGSPRVNINSASAQDLQDKLGLSANLANRLIQQKPGNQQAGGGGFPGGGFGGGGFPGGGNGFPGGNGGFPRPGGGNGGGPRPGGGNGGGPRPGGGGNGGGFPRPGGGGNGGGGGPRPGGGGGGGGARPNIRSASYLTRQVRPGGGGGSGGSTTPGGTPGGSGGTTTPGGNPRPGGGNGPGGNGGNGPGGNPRPGGGGAPGGGGGAGGGQNGYTNIGQLLQIIGFNKTVMQSIADHIAIDDNPYHENLVNVNTAPAEVLATVPGMTHDALNAILNYRQGGQAFQSLGDLFTLDGITQQVMQNILSRLCTKSSVYRVRIKVRTPGQQGLYAATALVELTDAGPTILQWREYPRIPGWSAWQTPPNLPTPTPPAPIGNTTSSSGR